MSIPEKCTVLVVGGGPGGSYAATVLAREGIDTVLLEADQFPRYHIGESMIASMRHFLRFVDLDSTFDQYGFTKKVGAAFKLSGSNREGYTDFLAAGGPDNYAWNVVRSEADDLMFKHARKCGAQAFDGVKIADIQFAPSSIGDNTPNGGETKDPGRPVSASWHNRAEGSSGTISFDYLVDASGRAGLVSTKYLKNRRFNTGLKNVASWAYWSNTGVYGPGTARANSPYFEALKDESGWVWLIPLHNGTTSVGVVMNQDLATAKKRAAGPSKTPKEFYLSSIQLAPNIHKLLDGATQLTGIKNASDYSYSASCYSSPYLRIVGDAGCFIDPYFSSGVHLALTSGLSAATTIAASIRGHDEVSAAQWHSTKFSDAYTRFLLVVLSAYKQIRKQEEPILSDFDEDNFDRAFGVFRSVIQGTSDTKPNLSQMELSKLVDFCSNAFEPTQPEERAAAMKKMNGSLMNGGIHEQNGDNKMLDDKFVAEEMRVLNHIRARKMLRTEDGMNIASFSTDVIGGYAVNLERGSLGLIKVN